MQVQIKIGCTNPWQTRYAQIQAGALHIFKKRSAKKSQLCRRLEDCTIELRCPAHPQKDEKQIVVKDRTLEPLFIVLNSKSRLMQDIMAHSGCS